MIEEKDKKKKNPQERKMEMLLVVWTGLNAITTMITADTDGRRLPTDKE